MKEQYIKRVKKELHLPRRAKNEVLRDLDEIFASAAEHGEIEQRVIERLGTPKEFADNAAEQFGVDNSVLRKRKEIISITISVVAAVIAIVIYAAVKFAKVPNGAIGQADAMTNIQIDSALGFDASQIILVVGIIATAFAAIQVIGIVCKDRRKV